MSGRSYHYVETVGVQVEFMPDYLRAGDDVLELRPIRAKDRKVSTACRICLRAELAPALITALLAIERERKEER